MDSDTENCTPGAIPGLSAANGGANTRQMVPAVPQRVVLDDELRGDSRAQAQREGRGAVQFVIREGAHSGSRLVGVPAQEFERGGLRYVVPPRVAITSRYSASTLVVFPAEELCVDHRRTSSLRRFFWPLASRDANARAAGP